MKETFAQEKPHKQIKTKLIGMPLKGDTNPWRDIGHAKWYDPYATLENPSHKDFKDAVDAEVRGFNKALKPHKYRIEFIEKAITAYSNPADERFAQETLLWNGLRIRIQSTGSHQYNVWFFDASHKEIHSWSGLENFGVDPTDQYMFAIWDIGKGSETLELNVYSLEQQKSLWKTSPVGPNAVFHKDKIVYQSVENQLRYPKILSADKKTGKHERTLYHNTDKRFQVELYETKDGPVVKIVNALTQRIGNVGNTGIQWITPLQEGFLKPISSSAYATDRTIVIGKTTIDIPRGGHCEDAFFTGEDILITAVKYGCTSLYTVEMATKVLKPLFLSESPNEIRIHKYASHPSFSLLQPNMPAELYDIVLGHPELTLRMPEPLTLPIFHHGFATSKDGTKVPYTFVSLPNPKKLIVEGYGSYGISSHRWYPIRWLPWIASGYAFAVSMSRGGRDNGDAWYDGGRTAIRKQNTFDDTAAVIRTVQKRFHIGPKKTVFYGRSAGGLLAASIAQQYPELVGAIYAEVPYVDVLRTTSNPDLPLTQLEYDEFGDPKRRPEEYKALKKISPVDTVPEAPKNAPFILVRTALHDSQVLPYESLKWGKHLAEKGWSYAIGVDKDGGHFTDSSRVARLQAEDKALIDAQLAPTLRKTRRLRSHVSRGTRRRRTSS